MKRLVPKPVPPLVAIQLAISLNTEISMNQIIRYLTFFKNVAPTNRTGLNISTALFFLDCLRNAEFLTPLTRRRLELASVSLNRDADEHLNICRSRNFYDPMLGTISIGRVHLHRLRQDRLRQASGAGSMSKAIDSNESRKIVKQIIAHLAMIRYEYGSHSLWPGHFDGKVIPEVNIGGAHGLPGILHFLAAAKKSNASPEVADEMIFDIKNFLFKVFDELGTERLPGFFPPAASKRSIRRPQWCYGPFSIALQLIYAAEYLNDTKLRDAATSMLLSSARLRKADGHFSIPHLCHGPIGTAYLFWKLFADFGQREFLEASLYWRTQGYKMLDADSYSNAEFDPRTVFPLLTSVGLNLAINSMEHGAWNGWDFLFGLDSASDDSTACEVGVQSK